MKIFTHPAVVALGASGLCLCSLIGPFVSPLHPAIYHLTGSAYSVFVPVLILFCGLWVVLALLLWAGRRPGWLHTAVWTGLMVLLPMVLLKNWYELMARTTPHWLMVAMALSPLLVLLLALAGKYPIGAALFHKAQRFTAVLLGFISLSILLTMGKFLLRFQHARGSERRAQLHHREQAPSFPPHRSRVIWIIFDELSFQQVYERRFPGLQMPNFDRLAQQSTVFTHTAPAGNYTDIVVPSLMTGAPADGVRFSEDGRGLALHDPVNGSWWQFDQHNTVFQDALAAGYKTSVAGWYNPYCRILPQVLDDCSWTSYSSLRVEMFPGQSVWWNTRHAARHEFESVFSWLYPAGRQPDSGRMSVRFHQLDYSELSASAEKALSDSSLDFVFLHMPVPHGVGIYDRRRGGFSEQPASYVDNLALTDRCLGWMRFVLEQHREWDSSAIVVMGDHSWRTGGWRQEPDWKNEDELASHNWEFDDRPAYIVKLPYQQSAARVDTAFAALRTREMLDGILAGRLKTPADLAAWAAQGD